MIKIFFVVRFANSEDRRHVFDGGPWVILGHCLAVQKWKPKFVPSEGELGRVAIWVRIPAFPIEMYGKHFLWRIGSKLGRMIKIDDHTLRMENTGGIDPDGTERARFARICVEVDLNQTLVAKFSLDDDVYGVEYEGLSQICFHCGRFGHRVDGCPMIVSQSKEPSSAPAKSTAGKTPTSKVHADQPFGDWMLVKRDQRRGKRAIQPTGRDTGPRQQNIPRPQNHRSGSRFNALGIEDPIPESSGTKAVDPKAPFGNNVEIIAINDSPTNQVPVPDQSKEGFQKNLNEKEAAEASGSSPVIQDAVFTHDVIMPQSQDIADAHNGPDGVRGKKFTITQVKNMARGMPQVDATESNTNIADQTPTHLFIATGPTPEGGFTKPFASPAPGNLTASKSLGEDHHGTRPPNPKKKSGRKAADRRHKAVKEADMPEDPTRERDRSLSPGSSKRAS